MHSAQPNSKTHWISKYFRQKWIIFVLMFAFIGGVILLFSSYAATSSAAFEPETGVLTGAAKIISNATASNSQAVQFKISTGSNTPVKIMPFGDSITDGANGAFSYRWYLWKMLKNAGYTNVDYVGNWTSNYNTGEIWDQNHEGHDGYWASSFYNELPGWLNNTHPDIALIHIGTNGGTTTDIGWIIDTMRSNNPNIKILLAQIIPRVSDNHAALNSAIATLATQKNTSQSPIVLVDQATGFNVSTDLQGDQLHPNALGDQKIANKWYPALIQFMP